MSIIHDALKKTQDKIKGSHKSSPKNQNFTTPNTNPYQKPSDGKNSYSSRTIIFLGILTLLLLGSILYYFLYNPAQTPTANTPVNQQASSPSTKIFSNGQNIKHFTENIQFQGTASNGSSVAALINNEIYEEGDTINGLFIKSIRKDEIDLTADGQSVTLRIQ